MHDNHDVTETCCWLELFVLLNVAASPQWPPVPLKAPSRQLRFLLQGQRLRQRRLYRSRGRLGQFHHRDYGYSITNVADVIANGSAPVYEKIGPVTTTSPPPVPSSTTTALQAN